jgi:hypothetical protein
MNFFQKLFTIFISLFITNSIQIESKPISNIPLPSSNKNEILARIIKQGGVAPDDLRNLRNY